ncbi:hypothetical protein [Ulvibacter antarcticus]|uniref:SpoIIAA-like protein n=1 Tax=Ulvibacter antarcticus TaxID=442714 RepID=A0A3L9Z1Q7_9FLAO|nr:hypothetical protein [Ulvibacter antarcticus]RMA64215.1 hypothetical protein BXY75_1085 [Ulvibacter antarcticus]
MTTVLQFEFGKVEIFDFYIVTTMKEGIIVIPEYNNELINVANKYFKNKPFAYITNRVNSYSVDPKIYIETSKIKNLVAFAVVTKEAINMSNVEVEKIFLKKPFQQFETLDEAIYWAKHIIKDTTVA